MRDVNHEPVYFFGRVCFSWQRLQRVTWLFNLPPHFGQRRALSFKTKVVRGRVRMTVIPNLLQSTRISKVWKEPV